MGVIEAASRLFELLRQTDDTFVRHLRTGLPEPVIAQILKPTGVTLPREAMGFYGHFSLPPGYQFGEDEEIALYDIYSLLALEDAAREYRGMQKIDELMRDMVDADVFVDRAGWFPLLQMDSNFYVLDTLRAANGICPVLDADEYEDGDVAFVSLEAFFDTLYHWVREGVLPIEEGHVAGAHEGNPDRVAEIARRFNPGVSRWAVEQET